MLKMAEFKFIPLGLGFYCMTQKRPRLNYFSISLESLKYAVARLGSLRTVCGSQPLSAELQFHILFLWSLALPVGHKQ